MNERTRRAVLGAGIPAAVVGAGLGHVPGLPFRPPRPGGESLRHLRQAGQLDDDPSCSSSWSECSDGDRLGDVHAPSSP